MFSLKFCCHYSLIFYLNKDLSFLLNSFFICISLEQKFLVVHFSKCLKTFSSFLLKNIHQNKHCNPWSNSACWELLRSLKWLLEPLQTTMLQKKKFRTHCWFVERGTSYGSESFEIDPKWPRECPLMTSENFWRFLTYLPFSTLKRPIFWVNLSPPPYPKIGRH